MNVLIGKINFKLQNEARHALIGKFSTTEMEKPLARTLSKTQFFSIPLFQLVLYFPQTQLRSASDTCPHRYFSRRLYTSLTGQVIDIHVV